MTAVQNDNRRYSRVAILLHWAMALLILANLVIGFFMEGLAPGPMRTQLIAFHLSSGMTILGLTALRVLWRLTHTPPPHPASMKPWEHHAANLGHFALYLAMVLMPLTGLGIISANPPIGSAGAKSVVETLTGVPGKEAEVRRAMRTEPRQIFGLVELPEIRMLQHLGATPEGIPIQREVHDDFVRWHMIGAFLTIGLLVLHLVGALKHQWFDGEAELARMGIGKLRPPSGS